jgi:hypothetical protein
LEAVPLAGNIRLKKGNKTAFLERKYFKRDIDPNGLLQDQIYKIQIQSCWLKN